MFILAFSKLKVMAAITSLSAGIMYSCLFTIPFILVAKYHTTESVRKISKLLNKILLVSM